MKKIEDIKEFEDIDTYYEISDIVAEVFKDRVEAHKHLVTANKKIERLNNIINELEKWLDEEYQYYDKYGSAPTGWAMGQINRTKDKLQELKGSDSNE